MEKQRRPVVLVVEDEPLMLMDAVDLVTEAGFEAIGTKNADEAIRILESRADIRIVFTDVNMPGSMDGIKLAHAVRHRWPPIEIIVTSGLTLANVQELLPERGVFFPKPYTPAQVASALHRLAACSSALASCLGACESLGPRSPCGGALERGAPRVPGRR